MSQKTILILKVSIDNISDILKNALLPIQHKFLINHVKPRL